MVKIVLVNLNGELEELDFKKYDQENLYKKCNFRKSDGFEKRHTWKVSKTNISVWARDTGRANQENKYEMPPPIDSDLYFGKMAIVASNKENPVDLTVDMWKKIYNDLMGGFEDLDDTALLDEDESDELDDIDDSQKTEHGYLKDGFVVNDKEIEDGSSSDYYEGSELEEEDYDD